MNEKKDSKIRFRSLEKMFSLFFISSTILFGGYRFDFSNQRKVANYKSIQEYRTVNYSEIINKNAPNFIGEVLDSSFSNNGNWKVPKVAERIKNRVPPTKSSIKKGRRLYIQNCETCHGEFGKGDGPAGKYLGKKVSDLTSKIVQSQKDGVLFYKITKGKAPMPAFNSILNSKQRWNLINYLRTFKQK